MKTFFKLVLWLVVVVVVLVAAAAVILPKYINPNDYKDQITAQVEKMTGRKLVLGGNIDLSVFPWLGVSLKQVSLGNAPGFGDKPMVSADELNVRVQLMPLLLNRKLLVDTIGIDGGDINLARNKEGKTNFADLMGGGKTAPASTPGAQPGTAPSKGPALSEMVLNGVDVKKTDIHWVDQRSGQSYSVGNLNVHTGELSFGRPVAVEVSGSFDAPKNNIAGDLSIKGDISVSEDGQTIRVSPLSLTGKLKGKAVPGGASDLALKTSLDMDMKAGTAKLTDMVLNAIDTQIKGEVNASGITTPTPSVSGKLSVDSANGPGLVSVLTGRPAPSTKAPLKINTALDANLKAGTIKLSDLVLTTLGTELKGSLDARNIQSKNSSVNGKLDLTSNDVNALLKAYGMTPPAADIKNLKLATAVSGTAEHFKLEPISVTASASGPMVPKGGADIKLSSRADVDLAKQTLALADLNVQGLGLSAKGDIKATEIKSKAPKVSGHLSVPPFNLRQLMGQLNIALPKMADPKALTKVGVDTQLAGSTKDLSLSGMKMQLDESSIAGNVGVANFADPAVDFALNINSINADRYLPPVPKEDQQGAKAPAAAPAGAGGAAAGNAKLPIDTLRKLKVKGSAAIGQLIFRNVKLSNVKININARDGDVNLAPMAANLYGGSYSGSINLNAKPATPTLSFDQVLKNVQIEPLLKDLKGKAKLRGVGDFSIKAHGNGADTLAIKRSLNGNGAFVFRNGAVKGFNIGKFLRKAQTGFIGKVDSNEETDFTELKGTYTIVNGVLHNKDLDAKSPLLRVQGDGSADLAREKIDYTIKATVVASAAGQGGAELAQLGGMTVPIKVSGSFDDPSFAPDIGAIAKAKAEKALKKQLDKQKLPAPAKQLLEGVLGGKKEQAAPPPTKQPAPTSGTAQPQPAPTKKQPVDKALKDLLNF